MSEVLDNPAWASLTGAHAHLAERHGGVLRYPLDVSPFLALPNEPSLSDWDDVAAPSKGRNAGESQDEAREVRMVRAPRTAVVSTTVINSPPSSP